MGEFDTWQRPSSEFAMRSAVIGELPRTLKIDALEAWYNGTAYTYGPYAEGRKYPWDQEFDNGKRIPLENRRPYQYNIARHIVNTSAGMLFGYEHFPGLEAEGDEKTEEWIAVLSEAVSLEDEMLRAAKVGGRARSVPVIFKVVEGYPRIEILPPQFCRPLFGPDGESLKHLRYQLKASAEYLFNMGYDGLDEKKQYWHRREYTPDAEIWYLPVEVSDDGTPPVFVVDESRTVYHNLGVLSGVWIPNLKSDDPVDGEASYEAVIDLMHQVNLLGSMAVRSIRKMSDPTLAYTNVEDVEDLPESQKVGSSSGGSVVSPGDVKLLEMTGGGQEAAKAWLADLKQAIGMISRVIEVDPEKLSGSAQSGYALRILHGPLIELVGELRLTYGKALIRLVRLMLEVVTRLPAGSIFLPRKVEGMPNPQAVLSLRWGDFFEPTPQDIKTEVETMLAAVAGGFLSEETARARICQLYNVVDVVGEAERIKRERGADPEHDGAEEAMRKLEGEQDAEV